MELENCAIEISCFPEGRGRGVTAWKDLVLPLFAPPGIGLPSTVNGFLQAKHYLGRTPRGFAYHDKFGVMVFANPSSRRLPQERWMELSRWCIDRNGVKDAGSKQWARAVRQVSQLFPHVTTIVSYSDPSAGHTGALYRACNWLWAPTWHRLKPPPTGNGCWDSSGKPSSVKDRWVFPLRPDGERATILRLDGSLQRRYPWAEYSEPAWHGGRRTGGGGDYKRFILEASGSERGASRPQRNP